MDEPGDRMLTWQRYSAVRARSLEIAAPLGAEDQAAQSMPDASPMKWHLAHQSWFFENLVLQPLDAAYRVHDARWGPLFNSYYEALGARHPRPQRGLLTRPALAEVHAYRDTVDRALARFIDRASSALAQRAAPLIELGIQHEQQHQELMYTDILHLMSLNPLRPAVCAGAAPAAPSALPARWIEHAGGRVEVGHAGAGFAFDNEAPRHAVLLQPHALASRLVSNAEYAQFVDDGGYDRAALWLAEGWALRLAQGWTAPPYWLADGCEFTLHGVQPRDPARAVRHLSFYEAAAYAQWAGARLPTEFEWEAAVTGPQPPPDAYGEVWQWTRSAYDPYPRFAAAPGAAGEYNGKFMVGQLVLRGSSCATPRGHARASYRNFFPPAARWQFSGLRLARDL
ncbi:MAG: ergothioneine biosynthesis protein EgtB [Burkholderiales bacterium]|nr:ergothioneine biosynthesis protein EgtB [Burkholderiales bacterium]MDE2160781.1 ergothioneine biosynthesis protein EgtB [Burkholderiales bacterium]